MADPILPVSTTPSVTPATEASLELALLRAGQLLLGRLVAMQEDGNATVAVKQGNLALLLNIPTATDQEAPTLGAPVRLEVVSAPTSEDPVTPLVLRWLSTTSGQEAVSGRSNMAGMPTAAQTSAASVAAETSVPPAVVVSLAKSTSALLQPAVLSALGEAQEAGPAGRAVTAQSSSPVAAKGQAAPPETSVPAGPREVLLPRVVSALAAQASPDQLFADLAQARDGDLPQPVRAAIEQMLDARASVGDLLRPAPLLNAILRSGVFLERNLADAASQEANSDASQRVAGDLKNALLTLKNVLSEAGSPQAASPPRETARSGEAPPPLRGDWPRSAAPAPAADAMPQDQAEASQKLLSHTESALARLDLLQFASLNDARPGEAPRSWMMEVPLALGQETAMLGLRVEEDGRLDVPAQERTWRIAFSLDSAGTGPVDALVRWRGGRVGVDLWAERGEAVRALQDGVDGLTQGLTRNGLAIDEIHCRTGRPAMRRADAGRLLDARS